MKKINLMIGALLLSLVALSYSALEVATIRAEAQNLTCIDLSNCCGSAACNSRGTVNGCTLTCDGGGTITCDRVSNGKCGGSGEEIGLEQ